MDHIELLRTARDEVLTGPDKWCQRTFGTDAEGHAIPILSIAVAERVCAVGAVMQASILLGMRNEIEQVECRLDALWALGRALPEGFLHVQSFNDHFDTKYPDVIDLFDAAIKTEEERKDNQ